MCDNASKPTQLCRVFLATDGRKSINVEFQYLVKAKGTPIVLSQPCPSAQRTLPKSSLVHVIKPDSRQPNACIVLNYRYELSSITMDAV